MRADSPNSISTLIWDLKYRLTAVDGAPLERSIDETRARIATALSVHEADAAHWTRRFREAFADFQLIPAGRISAGAGAARDVTLVNTFVMEAIPDDFTLIFRALAHSAETLRRGGGIGCDFSALRPRSAAIQGSASASSGPVPFLDLWDAACRTIMRGGVRRGAMMATLRCDHPDIRDFIGAKRGAGRLSAFNLSVLVTDAFMTAVRRDAPWPLRHNGVTYQTVAAASLWRELMRTTYACSEPGVLFIDRMNELNNLGYCETIVGTNSCAEQPLPPNGSCPLASINLARLIEDPFRPTARLDLAKVADLVAVGVRLLDNVLDVTRYPLAAQRVEAQATRRIGLGITGLADALIMCGASYGSPAAQALVTRWMETFRTAAYLASVDLARERGAFPRFERAPFLAAIGRRALPAAVTAAIRRHGIRNGVLTAIAPAGTMSMYAGNVSSGIEPVYSFATARTIKDAAGDDRRIRLLDYAYARYRELGGDPARLPAAFVTASALTPAQHLGMQAAVQRFIDAAISKTINCPEDIPFASFEDVYVQAYRLGCKGCATYRPTPSRGQVLVPETTDAAGAPAASTVRGQAGIRAAG